MFDQAAGGFQDVVHLGFRLIVEMPVLEHVGHCFEQLSELWAGLYDRVGKLGGSIEQVSELRAGESERIQQLGDSVEGLEEVITSSPEPVKNGDRVFEQAVEVLFGGVC